MERRPAADGVLDHRPRTRSAAGVARDTTRPRAGRVRGPPAAALRKLRLQGRPAQRRSSRSKTTRRGQSTTTPGSRPSTHTERDSSPIGSTSTRSSRRSRSSRRAPPCVGRNRHGAQSRRGRRPSTRPRMGRRDAAGAAARSRRTTSAASPRTNVARASPVTAAPFPRGTARSGRCGLSPASPGLTGSRFFTSFAGARRFIACLAAPSPAG